ncbi:MAG TPA: SAM-dependent methyltransferase, partial [Nitrospiria bacterium]|nr:SAM-dependent methyltransferase [Nitrospiria bacterium]
MSGTLYVVSTPIGNLEDITLRALRILREVQIVAAEDTRHSRGLLSRYDIHTPLTSYHDFNKEEKTPVLLQRLSKGESVALISDAGTPLISDPGYKLVREALDEGFLVTS